MSIDTKTKYMNSMEKLLIEDSEMEDNKDGLEDLIFQCPVKCGFSSMDEDEMFKHVRRHDLEALELRRTQDQAKAMDDAKARAEEQAEIQNNKAIADLKLWKDKLRSEKNLFRPKLPLSNAFLDPSYLDTETKTRVSLELKQQLLQFKMERPDDGEYYLYSMHDPRIGDHVTTLQNLCSISDRHTKFRIFLSSLFYIGNGKEDRDTVHLTERYKKGRGGNPRKRDRIAAIQRAGCQVHIQRFALGLNKNQARYMEALSLRATRLAGNVTNLKEEKVRMPPGSSMTSPFVQQLAGTVILWEASRNFGEIMEGTNIGKQRIQYTEADDVAILNFISTNNKYKYVGGVKLWIAMEEEGVVPGKTWQALKNRFRTKSLPNIHTFGLSQEFIQKFSGCHPGPARRKLRRKPKY